MMAQVLFILFVPAALAGGALLFKRHRAFAILNACGYFAVLMAGILLLRNVSAAPDTVLCFGFLYVDALSAFFIFVVSVVSFAASLYSIGYIQKDVEKEKISGNKARAYYLLFNLFCFSMFLVPAVNNLGMVWVAIEMTTLISAFLVGFYNTKKSVEAAWKYIMICSVGIIFALLGTILFSYAFSLSGGAKSLNWSDLAAAAQQMDSHILKMAFIFILIGYGTKAGLAPMHTWLPDAHSQAVTPISALLSGVLLKISLYAILRFGIILDRNMGPSYSGHLMVLLGILSLVVSAGFILTQKDLKRLLAYSSVEHVGIIAIGLGIGGTLGIGGALLHIFNHAVAKSLMFFAAGNVIDKYQKHHLPAIRGVMKAMPFTGFMLLMGSFALAGIPPFSIFTSEILIIISIFLKGSYLVGGLVLGLLAVIFGAIVHYFSKILFGNIPRGMAPAGEPLSGKAVFMFLFIPISVMGILGPFLFRGTLEAVLKIITGGSGG